MPFVSFIASPLILETGTLFGERLGVADGFRRARPPTGARLCPYSANISSLELTAMPANHSDLEKRLWEAADELRANSKLKSSEYSIPVLGLIFLRYADHKFAEAEKKMPLQASGRRKIGKTDYQAQGVLYLPEKARFGDALKTTKLRVAPQSSSFHPNDRVGRRFAHGAHILRCNAHPRRRFTPRVRTYARTRVDHRNIQLACAPAPVVSRSRPGQMCRLLDELT
jgi:HsdM N-terminal domain